MTEYFTCEEAVALVEQSDCSKDTEYDNAYALSFAEINNLLNAAINAKLAEWEKQELAGACGHYEAALMAALPNGGRGEAFVQWNEARKLLAKRYTLPSTPADRLCE